MPLQLAENIDLVTKTKYRKIDEDSDVKYSDQGQSEEISEEERSTFQGYKRIYKSASIQRYILDEFTIIRLEFTML